MGAKGRVNHTPKQRAQAALDTAQRMYDRAAKASDALAAEAEDALRKKNGLYEVLLHRKADPALQDDPTLPLGEH